MIRNIAIAVVLVLTITSAVALVAMGRMPGTMVRPPVRRSVTPPPLRHDGGVPSQGPRGLAKTTPLEPEGPLPDDVLVRRVIDLAVMESMHHGKMQDAQQAGHFEEVKEERLRCRSAQQARMALYGRAETPSRRGE